MSERIYDLECIDDTAAWRTHEIRSHRRRNPHERKIVMITAMAVLGSSLTVGWASRDVPPPVRTVEARTTDEPRFATPTARSMPVAASRSAVRKVSSAQARKAKLNRVIKHATAQRGDRYRFGASGPTRWDCSGLVMRAYGKAGKKLPHFTGGIIKKGKRVNRANLKYGDVVFPQRGHVGIYVGGGKMVHASSARGKVVVSKMYGFYTARRLL